MLDIQLPDNGGVSVAAYSFFGAQLPGPFGACADASFSPTAGSLDPASARTIPDLSFLFIELQVYSISGNICQAYNFV